MVGDDDYKKLKRKLNNHFLPKKNKHHTRYTFNKQKQIAGESVVTYAARLREKSKDCESGEQTDDRILEHLVQTSRTASSLKEAFRRNGTSINFLRKQAREKISISKSKISKKISKYRKSGMSQRIFRRRVANEAEEDT